MLLPNSIRERIRAFAFDLEAQDASLDFIREATRIFNDIFEGAKKSTTSPW